MSSRVSVILSCACIHVPKSSCVGEEGGWGEGGGEVRTRAYKRVQWRNVFALLLFMQK